MKRIFYVYEHWRPDTGQCFYVGKGTGDRAYRTQRRNAYHKNIVEKLRRAGLTFEVVHIAVDLSEREAFRVEQARISFWRSLGIRLANLTDGGDGSSGYRHTESSKLRMKKTDAQRKDISERMRNRVVSDKTKQKIREANLGKTMSQSSKEKLSKAIKGHVVTEEHRKRISKALLGRSPSEETRQLWSAQRKGKKPKPLSETAKARIAMKVAAYHASLSEGERAVRGSNISTANKGHAAWNRGLSASPEAKEKMRAHWARVRAAKEREEA